MKTYSSWFGQRMTGNNFHVDFLEKQIAGFQDNATAGSKTKLSFFKASRNFVQRGTA